MSRHPVLVFEILHPAVPLEIVGTIDGHTFYYRGRHERYAIYESIYNYGLERHPTPLSAGNAVDGEEADLTFAFTAILLAFETPLHEAMYPEQVN